MRERPQSDDEAARTDRCGQERLLIHGPGPEEKLCLTATFAESPDRACRTILATQVHWIHAKKAHEPQAQITVVVTVHDDGHVELDGDDLHLSLWNHDPAWLQSVLDQAGHHGLWKPGSMRCSHHLSTKNDNRTRRHDELTGRNRFHSSADLL